MKLFTFFKISIKLMLLILITFPFVISNALSGDEKTITGYEIYYDAVPNIINCNTGTLKNTEKQKVLARLNEVRALHGLNPVSYNYSLDKKTAESALTIVANFADHSFSMDNHNPPSSWHCYTTDALEGCQKGNLYYSSYSGTSENSIDVWLKDNGVETLGHRRWLLNPFLNKISYGRVDGIPINSKDMQSICGMSIYVISNDYADLSNWNMDFVAYPYEDYTPSLFLKNWYLSFQVIFDKTDWWTNRLVDFSAATISMKDEQNNNVAVSSIAYDNYGAGLPNCLRWLAPSIINDMTYYVSVKNVNVNGINKDYSYKFKLGTTSITSNNDNSILSSCYPNPFSDRTTIEFNILRTDNVKVKVYNSLGLEIATLKEDNLSPNSYSVEFDATNYPAGVYFYKIIGSTINKTGMMQIMK